MSLPSTALLALQVIQRYLPDAKVLVLHHMLTAQHCSRVRLPQRAACVNAAAAAVCACPHVTSSLSNPPPPCFKQVAVVSNIHEVPQPPPKATCKSRAGLLFVGNMLHWEEVHVAFTTCMWLQMLK